MLPVKRRKTIITGLDEHAVWLRDPQGRLLLHHESGKRRTGLWKLPLRESGEVSHLPMIAEHLYSITRFRVTLRVYDAAALRKPFILAPGDTWIGLHEVESLAMAAPFRKVTRQLLQDF
jgi:A/G-specific adenine glycosylase